MVCPRTRRQSDLFIPGGCSPEDPQRHREHHKSYGRPHTDRSHWTSWAHASQSHLKSYRGSFFHISVTFNVYIRIILSPKIGSSNPSHSHTWLSPQTPLTAQAMLCRCTQMSAEVRQIVRRSLSFFFSSVLEWNSGDRTKTILWTPSSTADIIFQCHTPGTGSVHRVYRPSGMGYSILCHAGRKLIAIYLLTHGL